MDDESRARPEDSNNEAPQESSAGSFSYDAPISALVLHEAAAAIEAVGRELTQRQAGTLRDFLRGPAMRVGMAVSVLGATLWIQELIERHRSRAVQSNKRATKQRASRRRPAPARAQDR